MYVRWKITEILNVNGITPYQLMKTSGLAQGTVYRLANNDAKGIDTGTLARVIQALRILTKQPITIGDVLEYVDKGDINGRSNHKTIKE
jgi:DNA-binding Xre family transcriptional regulator